MAELFGVQRPAITKHLKNIFNEGELKEKEISSILEHTTKHDAIKGKTRRKGDFKSPNNPKIYNLIYILISYIVEIIQRGGYSVCLISI